MTLFLLGSTGLIKVPFVFLPLLKKIYIPWLGQGAQDGGAGRCWGYGWVLGCLHHPIPPALVEEGSPPVLPGVKKF